MIVTAMRYILLSLLTIVLKIVMLESSQWLGKSILLITKNLVQKLQEHMSRCTGCCNNVGKQH